MKALKIHLLLLSCFVLPVLGDDTPVGGSDGVQEIGILPSSKRGTRVDVAERNPYAARTVEKLGPEDATSEASQIIQILEGLRVRGLSRDRNGNVRTVLYGDLRLTEGAMVPQLLPDQNDELIVSSLTNEEVELAWLSEGGNREADGRKILIAIELEPKVQIVLPGQVDVNGEPKKAWIGLKAEGEEDEAKAKLAAKK
tara:strand:+ start:6566 stop:7159 length:594 start_codon:yes stop_codon:yes gene_type:complete